MYEVRFPDHHTLFPKPSDDQSLTVLPICLGKEKYYNPMSFSPNVFKH